MVEPEACSGEDSQRHGHRGHGRIEHIADVGEERHADRGRGEHGRVRQQRKLVAEIGARDDGAGNPPFGELHRPADTHQRHADGGDRRPRTARHERHDGTYGARGDQEKRRMQDLEPVVDHRGHHARYHPRAGDGSDEQQDQDGRGRGADVVDDRLLEHRPAAAVDTDREHDADRRGGEQRDLAAAVDGIAPEGADHDIEQQRQHGQRNGRHPGRGLFLYFSSHFTFRLSRFRPAKIVKKSVFRTQGPKRKDQRRENAEQGMVRRDTPQHHPSKIRPHLTRQRIFFLPKAVFCGIVVYLTGTTTRPNPWRCCATSSDSTSTASGR